jgi:hypothetical protein
MQELAAEWTIAKCQFAIIIFVANWPNSLS